MTDFIPAEVRERLRGLFGQAFDELSESERVAVALAASEGTVNHARLRAFSNEHPVDISRTLQRLTKIGMLQSTGGRGAVYHLPGEEIPTPDGIFGAGVRSSGSRLPNLAGSFPILKNPLPALGKTTQDILLQRDMDGRLLNEQLRLPLVDDLSRLSDGLHRHLEGLAVQPRRLRKVNRQVMIDTILSLCADQYVTVSCLAELVNRSPDTLREQYLTRMVRDQRLVMAFPKTPTHELQAYCAAGALTA